MGGTSGKTAGEMFERALGAAERRGEGEGCPANGYLGVEVGATEAVEDGNRRGIMGGSAGGRSHYDDGQGGIENGRGGRLLLRETIWTV